MVNMTPEQLRRLARTLLEAAGTPNEVAATVAESLVESNLMGHDSHGVMRLLDYAPRVKSGLIRPDAKPEIVMGEERARWERIR
jgi:LDH2 family malate/lactate/ureidoglycolate dehydrogenase